MSVRNYADLVVWQKAMDFVEVVYRVTSDWPKHELYGLTNQTRCAVVSIPANIAEGHERSNKDLLRYLTIAHGSLREVETFLLIAKRLTYSDAQMTDSLLEQAAHVSRLLHGFKRHLTTEMAHGIATNG